MNNFDYLCTVKRIIAYKDYFADFMTKLSDMDRQKIYRALSLLKEETKVPRLKTEYYETKRDI